MLGAKPAERSSWYKNILSQYLPWYENDLFDQSHNISRQDQPWHEDTPCLSTCMSCAGRQAFLLRNQTLDTEISAPTALKRLDFGGARWDFGGASWDFGVARWDFGP
eukprot:3314656-Rhodomonas_salina.1